MCLHYGTVMDLKYYSKSVFLPLVVMVFVTIWVAYSKTFIATTGATTISRSIPLNKSDRQNGICTTKSNCSTLIIRLKGRLGNMMFQYASILGIADNAKFSNVVVENGERLKEVFLLSNAKVSFSACKLQSTSVNETKCCAFDNRLGSLNNSVSVRIDGYLQSWRYFDAIRDIVRKEFTFSTNISDKAGFKLHNVLKTCNLANAIFVGVHIRRGDFTDEKFKNVGFLSAPLEYIIKAMTVFSNLYANRTVFVICSDEMQWANDVLSNVTSIYNIYFMEGNSAEVDMAILSKCNHTVITTGTFGWWAAWLAGGTATVYKKHARENTTLWTQYNYKDYFYPSWLQIE